jgi:putative ABC transport system substrate-binding protein
MRRREFLLGVAGASTAWPLAATAQAPNARVLGVLVLGSPPPEPFLKGLREELHEAGYVEGRNLRLEIRNAEGRAPRLVESAAELVALRADVIVAYQTPAATAAKQVAAEVPVVFVGVGDPIGTGLIATLARPGGNVTGASAGTGEVAGKTVELIRELLPSARRLAVLANAADPFTPSYLTAIGGAARSLGIDMEPITVRPSEPLEAAFEAMLAKGSHALVVQGTQVRAEAADLALKHRLPAISNPSIWPRLGGLLSHSPDSRTMVREAVVYVDRIFKGAKPADLPVTFPTKFEMIVNLKTANALGLTIPSNILSRADEVIA